MVRIWVGIIEAVKKDVLFCADCLAERRQERAESDAWELEGEDWRESFNPDDPNGEEWKENPES